MNSQSYILFLFIFLYILLFLVFVFHHVYSFRHFLYRHILLIQIQKYIQIQIKMWIQICSKYPTPEWFLKHVSIQEQFSFTQLTMFTYLIENQFQSYKFANIIVNNIQRTTGLQNIMFTTDIYSIYIIHIQYIYSIYIIHIQYIYNTYTRYT